MIELAAKRRFNEGTLDPKNSVPWTPCATGEAVIISATGHGICEGRYNGSTFAASHIAPSPHSPKTGSSHADIVRSLPTDPRPAR